MIVDSRLALRSNVKRQCTEKSDVGTKRSMPSPTNTVI